jgi:predicted AlkP superfamily phosphohydrolase/phosphomutase
MRGGSLAPNRTTSPGRESSVGEAVKLDPRPVWRHTVVLLAVLLALLAAPEQAPAYVGPGAGFALVSSFFVLVLSFLAALLSLLTWPFRWIWSALRLRRAAGKARHPRVVVIGFDGLDPELTEQFMGEGLLPNLTRLRESGFYSRLRTTLPAESPVAWSSFQTGCNPGRHGIFDFFTPNRKTYLPELSSADVRPPRRKLKIGRYQIPIGQPELQLKRRSRSFWSLLGEHGIFSTILRVPISFPPERFNGLLLSAMSVPDLNGTQGTFTYYSSDPQEQKRITGGVVVPVQFDGQRCELTVTGPENPVIPGEPLTLRIPLALFSPGRVSLRIDGREIILDRGEFTPWVSLRFRAAPWLRVSAICRFLLKETSPHLRLYVSPLNIDPARPALPISHPLTFGIYLSRMIGSFCTLGMCEDTWALNERVLDEDEFLRQCYSVHEEREKMLFDALEKSRFGAVVCVFDITDRMQHMFWRYLEPEHPANKDKESRKHVGVVRDLYIRMDDLVGRVLERLRDDTLLLVMSDHGFKSFQRGVNLNSWLRDHGFLALKAEADGSADWLRHVEWGRTKAYSMGLGGIFLNRAGREAQGIVAPGQEERATRSAIAEGLRCLQDPARKKPAVAEVYDTRVAYDGPYTEEAPDLIVGFHPGYRVSWSSATGAVTPEVFEDNVKSWSGDHCVNPPIVPGVLFCNRKLASSDPAIVDIAPTVLEALGAPIPEHIEGRSLLAGPGAKPAGEEGSRDSSSRPNERLA